MARAIDWEEERKALKNELEMIGINAEYTDFEVGVVHGIEYCINRLDLVPTLTPPNEPLTQADIDKMHFDRVWIDYGVDDSGERCGEEGVVLYGKLYDIDTLEGAGLEEMLLDTGAGETLDRPSGDYKVYRRPPGEAE